MRLLRPLIDPGDALVHWRALVDAKGLIGRHARQARAAGFDRVYLLLSFDCDTADDAAVAVDVHRRLARIGVEPTYAVPGALLERHANIYAPLAADGAQFLNHGGVEHTRFDEDLGRHASSFFYDTLTPEQVRQDVEDGDRIAREVLGRPIRGWRTPHFGTYREPAQLRYVHSVLCELGYRFSSSTLPRVGLRHGPVYDGFGLPELPLTGVPVAPLQILDTWGFFAAPDRHRTPADYIEQAGILAERIAAAGAGVINVYGDPVHIHDRPEFFEAVELWASIAESVSFTELLDRQAA